jgi:hypothetical protein
VKKEVSSSNLQVGVGEKMCPPVAKSRKEFKKQINILNSSYNNLREKTSSLIRS